MYVPTAFKVSPEVALAFVAERAFGLMVAVDGGLPVGVHVPFVVAPTTDARLRLEAHVARANPFHAAILRAPSVLVAVSGPDAYVSPDWYVTKDQVPTWNYIAVHVQGTARLLPPEQTLDHVDRLSAAFEARLHPKPAWRSEKVSPEKRRAMLAAIVAFEVEVESVEGQWKLGQHKLPADRLEVAKALAWQDAWASSALSEVMTDQVWMPR